MNKFNETASSAMTLASDTASRLKEGMGRWVPGAMKAIGTGTNLIVLHSGSKKIAGAMRRNPLITAAAATATVGAGVALWILKRNRQRALDQSEAALNAPLEVKPVRVGRKPAQRTARKASSRKVAAKPAATT
jgi:hypothetical protein